MTCHLPSLLEPSISAIVKTDAINVQKKFDILKSLCLPINDMTGNTKDKAALASYIQISMLIRKFDLILDEYQLELLTISNSITFKDSMEFLNLLEHFFFCLDYIPSQALLTGSPEGIPAEENLYEYGILSFMLLIHHVADSVWSTIEPILFQATLSVRSPLAQMFILDCWSSLLNTSDRLDIKFIQNCINIIESLMDGLGQHHDLFCRLQLLLYEATMCKGDQFFLNCSLPWDKAITIRSRLNIPLKYDLFFSSEAEYIRAFETCLSHVFQLCQLLENDAKIAAVSFR